MENNDLPIGFIMSMARNSEALKYFGSLDNTTVQNISNYIKASSTGEEAKQKIDSSVNGLASGNIDFLN